MKQVPLESGEVARKLQLFESISNILFSGLPDIMA